jgi:hypothetical protein
MYLDRANANNWRLDVCCRNHLTATQLLSTGRSSQGRLRSPFPEACFICTQIAFSLNSDDVTGFLLSILIAKVVPVLRIHSTASNSMARECIFFIRFNRSSALSQKVFSKPLSSTMPGQFERKRSAASQTKITEF